MLIADVKSGVVLVVPMIMKKIFIYLGMSFLVACLGNENAENQPTDVDQTKNNDTSAVIKDSINTAQRDSTDTSRLHK